MSILRPISVTSVLVIFRTALVVSSQNSALYFFYERPAYPRDCKEALDSCHNQRLSGVYAIKPDGYHRPFEVYCDTIVDSGGWTVILRRHDGSVNFQRNWLEYKFGFGFLSQELWIGTEKLSYLTNQNVYELRIDFTFSDGRSTYLIYKFFRITDDFSKYKLTSLGLYAGADGFRGCPTNMEYGTCLCQFSCECPQECLPCSQEERCFCPNGFYLKGAKCVPQKECGCVVDGNTIGEGVWYVTTGCVRRYLCTDGNLRCENNYQCGNNAVCERRNNVLGCYCIPGYLGDGVTCRTTCPANTEYGVCTCETHCRDPNDCVPCSQSETCYCTNGYFVALNGTCVRRENCGCYDDDDGIVIPEGQIYTPPDCSKRCICINGQRHCNNNYQCSSDAVCETRNGIIKCYCNPGFNGDGETCVPICQDDRVFGTCTCETTCANPLSCQSCTQGQLCHCPSGSYLQGSNCVQPDECRCFTDERIIPEGQTYTSPDCSRMCICTNGQLDCNNNYQCSPDAVCGTRNNARRCYCNPGYVGDGVTCCQANRILGTCPCETTCANPHDCGSCTQSQPCYCPSGFFIQGQDCVRQEDCGCYIDSIIVPDSETYVNTDCTLQCTCNNNQLDCDPTYQCSPNAACTFEDEIRRCVCNDGYSGDGQTCAASFTDCFDAYQAGLITDDIYTIMPTNWPGSPFEVFCNMTFGDGGWTVFQRRIDGVTDFYRGWEEYKQGFGTLNQGNDFWLGNEQLHYLTDQRDYILRIDFVHSSDRPYYEEFTKFKIGDESDKYRLSYDSVIDANTGWSYGYSALYYNNGKQFSTRDQDNDGCSNHHFAQRHKGGWWYHDYYCTYCVNSGYCFYFKYGNVGCHTIGTATNLNGDYNGGSGESIFYNVIHGNTECNHKFTEMKFRPSI